MRLVRLGMLLVLALSAAPATATTTYEETISCPIGGEQFKVTSISSYTTFGQRPDGMPYGTLIFPVPLHECPGNRLLLYRDFTPDELKQLEPLIASQAWRDLVALERTYYRASWLERRLRPDRDDWIWLLLRATWQADGDPTLKARYQTEFAEARSR